jgi:hypothetical protein
METVSPKAIFRILKINFRSLKFAEQFNKQTSFIDASVVYGNNDVSIFKQINHNYQCFDPQRFYAETDSDPFFKGTVSRDFRPSVFFIKQSPLGP